MSSKTVNTYILLDRSGSMASRWDEAFSSINSYVNELSKSKVKSLVTVALFDDYNGLSFDVIRDKQTAKKWDKLTDKDGTPRGMTPLFDALGRIVSMAESDNNKKTVLVVMTDGHENASREITKEQAKSSLDRFEDKKWQVVFLGADFNAFGQSATVGVPVGKTLNMVAGNYGASMRGLATKTQCYASASTDISFSDKDRENASK